MKLDKDMSVNLIINNKSFQAELKNNLNGENLLYEQFLSSLEIVHEDNEAIFLLVPTQIKEYVKRDFSELINRIINNVYERKMNIIFITNLEELKNLNVLPKTKNYKNEKKSNIIKDLTFENYAPGKFNSVALKAARSIYENDQVVFSPLFIYSSSGLGKTHLLNAIGNELMKKNKTCYYVNPDMLTRKLVEQLKNKNQEEINKIVDNLVSYDCLMFDDVQQYGNRESTLTVLFNIINTLMNDKKQIIIAADKRPEDLGGFEQRFITRFNGGLTVEIMQPEMSDVISILNFKLKQNNINPELWEEESMKFIARNFSNSIRSLEGAINRIKLFSQGDDFFTYDLATIKMIFKNVSQIKETITPETIIDAVSRYYKIDKRKIVAKTRKEEIVMARRIAMWLVKNNFDYSLDSIGKMFGNQSHSTVIVSVKWIDKNIKTNSALKLAIEKIKGNLRKIL
ncbi:chromosomal replication initiator protein DnaA [Metamycoplasma arthritidis]|uniref:Chromosomal replication initiator protein DnaA n=1 Tax=Metamycoplasma arthritidis (strain 158L3-1) TaxID=243272 RepID=B3PLR7_META1|nr:chromosomal replication initiator protein DnaA [Metamycoplasma arthritidis]ACF06969.1 chromosomal replication initiator protein DnaA [Metamycoplasma arthritidis 158L3-1]VEU78498.1 chromosomal replication initiator protein DnaA [Metamycoplasma arthritidis]